jgi:hypothetical protein
MHTRFRRAGPSHHLKKVNKVGVWKHPQKLLWQFSGTCLIRVPNLFQPFNQKSGAKVA